MFTRRVGGDDDTALCPHPLSASRRFSPPSLQKENSNSNPRRSTFHKTLPRGCSSSPSDLPRSLSAQKPTLDPTPKPKLKPKPNLKPKPLTTSQEGIDTIRNNKYPSKLHEKLAFLKGKVKRIASDIKKTLAKDSVTQDKVLSPVQDNSVVVEFLALIENEGEKVNAGEQVKAKGVGNSGLSERKCDIDEMLEAD